MNTKKNAPKNELIAPMKKHPPNKGKQNKNLFLTDSNMTNVLKCFIDTENIANFSFDNADVYFLSAVALADSLCSKLLQVIYLRINYSIFVAV